MKRPPDRSGLARDLLPFAVVLAGIIGVLLATTFLYVRISHGLRAHVNGESVWSKAQKEAVFELDEYAASGEVQDLEAYRQALRIPLAHRRARELLLAPELDGQAARRALVEGGSDPEDVSAMILVIRGSTICRRSGPPLRRGPPPIRSSSTSSGGPSASAPSWRRPGATPRRRRKRRASSGPWTPGSPIWSGGSPVPWQSWTVC